MAGLVPAVCVLTGSDVRDLTRVASQKTNRASLLTRGLPADSEKRSVQRECAYFFDFLRLRFFGAAFALRFALFAIVRLFLDWMCAALAALHGGHRCGIFLAGRW